MSNIFAEVVYVDGLKPHPNADRLEIAEIRGATVVVPKDSYRVGQVVVYFPPDLLIPELVADRLGVKKYLKHAYYSLGDPIRTQCRVAATRIRSYPSFGFIASIDTLTYPTVHEIGDNVSQDYDARKYEAPVRPQHVPAGDAAPEYPAFHKYTELEHYWRYNQSFQDGEPVRITEKLHGTNSRVGLLMVDGEFQFFAGSHHRNRQNPRAGDENRYCVYWEVIDRPGVKELLTELCDEKNNVIVFGEIYGPSIQDMDYGVARSERGYRVFDISVNGIYLDWVIVKNVCSQFGVETVPVLYEGPFSQAVVFQHRDGPTTLGTPAAKFKGREGVVITPLKETFCEKLNGRKILKSVSADYLDRKGAQDFGEFVDEVLSAAEVAEPTPALFPYQQQMVNDLTSPDAALVMPFAERQAEIIALDAIDRAKYRNKFGG